MKSKKNLNILEFPSTTLEAARQIEAILFAAEEPLDIESIRIRLKTKCNVLSVLESLKKQYENRGINKYYAKKKF